VSHDDAQTQPPQSTTHDVDALARLLDE